MKNLILVFISITFFSSSKPTISTYNLKTAIEKNLVACKFNGNFESPHYYQALEINITNLTNKEIKIRIPNGQRFTSDSTDIQDVIITQEELIALSSNKNKIMPLFSMCIQEYNSAPNESTTYRLGDLATGKLFKITNEIEKTKSFNTIGQYSVWAITDDYPLDKIDGFNEKEAIQYQKYMAILLNVPVPSKQTESYKTYYETTKTLTRSVVGKFKYNIHNQSNITIGLFNEQDIIVRELYNNPNQEAGEHLFNYAFDATTYQDPRYYIRLIINGNIKVSLKMEPRKS
ncbi:MAG: hypothetical protein COB12_10755 [Flavobacterium sp.]|nr:MAG: hypothetical protein COB12_10755 [Flavobacterium sp.]